MIDWLIYLFVLWNSFLMTVFSFIYILENQEIDSVSLLACSSLTQEDQLLWNFRAGQVSLGPVAVYLAGKTHDRKIPWYFTHFFSSSVQNLLRSVLWTRQVLNASKLGGLTLTPCKLLSNSHMSGKIWHDLITRFKYDMFFCGFMSSMIEFELNLYWFA